MAAATTLLGGQAAFTMFIVYMIRCACCKPKRSDSIVKRHVYISSTFIALLLDDVDLCKTIAKELDKRRRPPIARFRHARLDGVTVAAMDKLRFASIWTPGHSTLSKEVQKWEEHLEKHWCKCTAKATNGTRRTVEQ